MFFDISKADIEELDDDLFLREQVSVSVLRLDKIHPVVSGNKLFKLHYFLQEAILSDHKTILSFGGAYSNHLAATAFTCKVLNLKCIGIVRGEQPGQLSPTLQQCINDGMQLKFITRQEYEVKENTGFISSLQNEFGEFILVPEGGYHPLGAKGAALIMYLFNPGNYTHICTATGTVTTLAGLLTVAKPELTISGIPVLKGMTESNERIKYLANMNTVPKNLQILEGYHFGGYAKKTDQLIQFMNFCWQQYQLPLDFVYTAKMLFAVTDCVKNKHFPRGSKILCLHTGGLQGNKSLPLNTLLF
jgi:1-aminocyclopropane-1-carboxylate deaminase/D-cysteine desulfhydrase-like pyridoxal-dependent ACC family enzyme